MQSTTLKSHRGDQSWEMSERMLLTSLIIHAVSQRETGQCNLAFCVNLLDNDWKELANVMGKSPIIQARKAFKRFLGKTTEGYRNLVANGLQTRLDIWNQPHIAKVTETTTIDFEALQDQLWTLYLAVPADAPEVKPLAALVLNLALDQVLQRDFKHPMMMMLDEFTNYGYVRGLPAKLSIIRHDNIPVVLGVQDYVQLELAYDKEAKLLVSQPATKIFFKPNDMETADKISKMLGLAIQETEELTSAGQLQKRKEKEPLLSVDDLMNLGAIDERKGLIDDGNHMIVFIPKTRPVLARALTWREYSDQTNQRKYPPPSKGKLEYSDGFTWAPPSETLDLHTPKAASEKNEIDKPRTDTEKDLPDDKADELLGGALDEW
jgi:type IV secretory pathway TraG/TraD family ATPase VirD4